MTNTATINNNNNPPTTDKCCLNQPCKCRVKSDTPQVMDRLVMQRPLSVWQVEQEIRTLRQHATLTAAVERLTAKGVTVVSETDQTEHARVWRTVDDAVGRDQARAHRSEPCHAVLVKVAWDGTTATEIALCIEPRRHKGATPASTLPASPTSGTDPTGAAERRDRKQAAQARTAWLTERLATRHPFPTADATRQRRSRGSTPSPPAKPKRPPYYSGWTPEQQDGTKYSSTRSKQIRNDSPRSPQPSRS